MVVMPGSNLYGLTTEELCEFGVYVDKEMHHLAVRCLRITMSISILACFMGYTRPNLGNEWYIHSVVSELPLLWAVIVASMCMVGCAAMSLRITYYMRYSDDVSDLADAITKSIDAKIHGEILYTHVEHVLAWCAHTHIVIIFYTPTKQTAIVYINKNRVFNDMATATFLAARDGVMPNFWQQEAV